ncbi:MAG: hypothetical protein LBH92_06305 [Bacteroidales bacterium]|jgi:hypothetical protein|nr:hypothetical protein [Bacteroidales bacterium]
MFVRKKKNSNDVVNVQVIDKSRDKYRFVQTIDSSSDAYEVEKLYKEGKKWIDVRCGNHDIFTIQAQEKEERQVTDYLFIVQC